MENNWDKLKSSLLMRLSSSDLTFEQMEFAKQILLEMKQLEFNDQDKEWHLLSDVSYHFKKEIGAHQVYGYIEQKTIYTCIVVSDEKAFSDSITDELAQLQIDFEDRFPPYVIELSYLGQSMANPLNIPKKYVRI